MTPSTPIELLIVEGTPMRLPDGTTVRFVRDGQSLKLADVPACCFSEVLRDVDLFVSSGDTK